MIDHNFFFIFLQGTYNETACIYMLFYFMLFVIKWRNKDVQSIRETTDTNSNVDLLWCNKSKFLHISLLERAWMYTAQNIQGNSGDFSTLCT